jgi:hypothetical protein
VKTRASSRPDYDFSTETTDEHKYQTIKAYIQNAKLDNYKNVPDPQWMFAISMFSKLNIARHTSSTSLVKEINLHSISALLRHNHSHERAGLQFDIRARKGRVDQQARAAVGRHGGKMKKLKDGIR